MPATINSNVTEDDKVICNCKNVTLGEIKTAIANGASTVDEIKEKTSAGTGCGKCTGLLEKILEIQK